MIFPFTKDVPLPAVLPSSKYGLHYMTSGESFAVPANLAGPLRQAVTKCQTEHGGRFLVRVDPVDNESIRCWCLVPTRPHMSLFSDPNDDNEEEDIPVDLAMDATSVAENAVPVPTVKAAPPTPPAKVDASDVKSVLNDNIMG